MQIDRNKVNVTEQLWPMNVHLELKEIYVKHT